jgi:hypothetical protein
MGKIETSLLTPVQKAKVIRFAEDMVLTIDMMGYRPRRADIAEIGRLIATGGYEGAYRYVLELSMVDPILLSGKNYNLYRTGYKKLAGKYERLLDAHAHQRTDFKRVLRTAYAKALAQLNSDPT